MATPTQIQDWKRTPLYVALARLIAFPFCWLWFTTWPKKITIVVFGGLISSILISDKSVDYWWMRAKGETGVALHQRDKVHNWRQLMQELAVLSETEQVSRRTHVNKSASQFYVESEHYPTLRLDELLRLHSNGVISTAALKAAARFHVRVGDGDFFRYAWDGYSYRFRGNSYYSIVAKELCDEVSSFPKFPTSVPIEEHFWQSVLDLTGSRMTMLAFAEIEGFESDRAALRALKDAGDLYPGYSGIMNILSPTLLRTSSYYNAKSEAQNSPGMCFNDGLSQLGRNEVISQAFGRLFSEPNSTDAQVMWAKYFLAVINAEDLYRRGSEKETSRARLMTMMDEAFTASGTDFRTSPEELTEVLLELGLYRRYAAEQEKDSIFVDLAALRERLPKLADALENDQISYALAIAVADRFSTPNASLRSLLPSFFLKSEDKQLRRFGAFLILSIESALYDRDRCDGISEAIDKLGADLRKRTDVESHYFEDAFDEESPISSYFLFCLMEGYLTPEEEQLTIDWAKRADETSRQLSVN